MISVDTPFLLGLAPLVALGVALAVAWVRGVRVRRAGRWSREAGRTARAAGRFAPAALGLAALLCTVALAGPRWGDEKVVAETRGLNLVLAIDISRSMLAEDATPSRLGRALREARRLVLDLAGDRLGLIAFAGTSYILSPLSPDGSAVTLHLDALEPDVASEGGTALARALRQGGDLLRASPELADRVLVVFTDGEAHDSLPQIITEARRLHDLGMRVILVAGGGRAPVRIPLRDASGVVREYQRDGDGEVVETRRRDDVLTAIADAAQGALVAAELPDQAGAVRDLVAAYKRARSTETRTRRGSPRAWVAALAAASVLLAQALTRRTAALVAFALLLAPPGAAQRAGGPRTAAERAWDAGRAARAAELYAAEVGRGGGDAAQYNAGTAALAAGDPERARGALEAAARSLDPDIRFRALYNLGWLHLDLASRDSVHRDAYLGVAERALREALRLRPGDPAAKWNLELAARQRPSGGGGGGGSASPPRGTPGGAPPAPGGRADPSPAGASAGISQAQAEEILRSIGQEELETRRSRLGRTRGAGRGGKDW